jgi:hypothetical protein
MIELHSGKCAEESEESKQNTGWCGEFRNFPFVRLIFL